MFWRFGGYANISTIDTILDRPDFKLEDLLDEGDLIQELKSHNAKLIEYLRGDAVLKKLLEYVIAPKLEPVENPDEEKEEKEEEDRKGKSRLSFSRPRASSRATNEGGDDEDDVEKKRNRYAFVSAEILSSDNWSIFEALMENKALLMEFWTFLKRPAPLDPLQASYFTKVNESLFDKKTEEMIDLLKSVDDAVPNMLRHVDCPMIMDLLLKIISLERVESGQGIVENVMPTLLSFLGPEHSWSTQTSAGDFMKAIITVSANASQNEQACIGPNELTRQLVSKPCIEQLIQYMLGGGNPLTVGVGIIIEVIRKNNSDYDPEVGSDSNTQPSSRDPIYLGTLLRLFAEHVPDFMNLIMNAPTEKQRLNSTFGDKIEPLGFDRFKTCELMAELLHCSNMALLNEVGSEQLIALRDEERQKLRAEGKLAPNRGEEAHSSAEDLTMRGRHSSPEDIRRLEVTNASDDDGFEEVTPSGEMTEDTSHEFVKAEEEITAGPAASFLDRDDDDFVDEPLSSPRLRIQDGKMHDQEFDHPELVVAPLSPRKPGATANEESMLGRLDGSSDPTPPITGSDKTEEQGGDKKTLENSSDETKPSAEIHVEESKAQPSGTSSSTSSTEQGETHASTVEQAVPSPDQPSRDAPPTVEITTTEVTEAGAAEAESIMVGHEPSADDQQLKPVVGDFLKMQFVEHKVVPTILSFFFKYPWNNFLHNVVYDIVQQVFNGPMISGFNPTLAISLFEAADVTNAIINGQLASEKSQAEHKTRMGYMGHLTLIAEEVVKFTERNPPELLSDLVVERVMSQDWINYVEGPLAETRERDNAILGGVRPEVAMSNRAAMAGGNGLGGGMGLSSLGLSSGGSNALADAGLNGGIDDNGSGTSNSIGPFSISGGGLLGSGFGSSSDEEDDEDNEEDVNNEFRAYTDPLNASNSLNPPSIPPPPPPPPPLNIPPSRARLQLAARLAMHQKGATTASSQSAMIENADDDDDGREQDSVLRNPFGDDAEDDDVDSDDDGLGDDGNSGAWGSSGRGSWWRGALSRRSRDIEKFGDGRDDDSDSDQEDKDEDDEEFGDFAMPEVSEKQSPPSPEKDNIIVKPLPVHPPSSGVGKGVGFTSLWPFGNKQQDKQQDKDKDKGKDKEKSSEAELEKMDHDEDMLNDDGKKIEAAHEAKARTSIEDPDEEEADQVVV